jgi:hypothetical protein
LGAHHLDGGLEECGRRRFDGEVAVCWRTLRAAVRLDMKLRMTLESREGVSGVSPMACLCRRTALRRPVYDVSSYYDCYQTTRYMTGGRCCQEVSRGLRQSCGRYPI